MKITQAITFEAAHRLPNLPKDHKCFNLHGHSYRVEVTIEGEVDPHAGFVIDFFQIEGMLNFLHGQVDHKLLNDVQGLENPTVENIAIWFWDRIAINAKGASLREVKVFETSNCWATYNGK